MRHSPAADTLPDQMWGLTPYESVEQVEMAECLLTEAVKLFAGDSKQGGAWYAWVRLSNAEQDRYLHAALPRAAMKWRR